jgi:hypothetical protein
MVELEDSFLLGLILLPAIISSEKLTIKKFFGSSNIMKFELTYQIRIKAPVNWRESIPAH